MGDNVAALSSMRSGLLGFALSLATAGFKILPADAKSGELLIPRGAATREPATIRQWWASWPDARVKVTRHDLVVAYIDADAVDEDGDPKGLWLDCSFYGTADDGRDIHAYRARNGARYARHPEPDFEVEVGAVVEPFHNYPDAPWTIEKWEDLPEPEEWLEVDEWAIDLVEQVKEPPPVVLNISPRTAGALFGDGGMGKSTIAMHAGVCVALGRPFFGTPVERRNVLYLACEDAKHITLPKLKRICAYERVEVKEVIDRFRLMDVVGKDVVLWKDGATTAVFEQLRSRIKRYGSELLIIDGIADTYVGSEQDNEPKRFINALIGFVPDRGAVLLLGHVTKQAAANPDTEVGYRGSAAWHNAVRARWYLRPRKGGGRLLIQQKRNYGDPKASPPIEFDWDAQAGVFVGNVVVERLAQDDSAGRDEIERDGILRALKAATAERGAFVPAAQRGPRNAYKVLSQRAEFPSTLRGNDAARKRNIDRFFMRIGELRANALIEDVFIAREAGRRRRGIVLTSKGKRVIEQ